MNLQSHIALVQYVIKYRTVEKIKCAQSRKTTFLCQDVPHESWSRNLNSDTNNIFQLLCVICYLMFKIWPCQGQILGQNPMLQILKNSYARPRNMLWSDLRLDLCWSCKNVMLAVKQRFATPHQFYFCADQHYLAQKPFASNLVVPPTVITANSHSSPADIELIESRGIPTMF